MCTSVKWVRATAAATFKGCSEASLTRRAAEPAESTPGERDRETSRTKRIDALTRMERSLTIS
jgi:hypothetical protein